MRRPAASVAAVVLLCGGCGLTTTPPESTEAPTATSGPDPTSSPTREAPEPSATPSPTAGPTAAAEPLPPVWLTAESVGTVELGAEGAMHDLLLQLGPLDSYAELRGACPSSGSLYAATWGDLEVFLEDGTTVQGWATLGPDLPANVQPPHGLTTGASIDVVRALPEAEDVTEEDHLSYGPSVLADGISWYHADDTVVGFGVNVPYCGGSEE